MTQTPAGWYPDPEGATSSGVSAQRWWNGVSWGDQRRAPEAPPQGADQPAAPRPGPDGAAPGHPPQLRCLVCGWHEFGGQEYLLNTRAMTFFGADAFNAGANCQICRRCGFIHWFAQS